MEEGGVSKPLAAIACVAMAFFYVAILYSPTLIIRLPPPTSFESFMVRRFVCAGVSSVVSVVVCALILPIKSWEVSYLSTVYGIRSDHIWQAVVFPLSLTSLMYAGSFVVKSMSLLNSLNEHWNCGGDHSINCIKNFREKTIRWTSSVASSVLAWRNYVVAPFTEELVFRACMIPLLLCGGFKTYTVIFFCPISFSLAHLNHFLELYTRQNHSFSKASMIAGLQLGYTVIFGSYASFLFIRTGHLIAPLVAHIFCNIMGLPFLYSRGKGMASVAFVSGMAGFLWLLFPVTRPDLYNDRTDDCSCWHRYCTWH